MRDTQRPTPTADLDSPEEIAEMVRRFYLDVAQDDLLGPMFNEVAHVDWSEHLPKLTAFWCRTLLGTPGYIGNPMRAHAVVHQKRAFTPAHFERWLTLFHETLELGWIGPNAERAAVVADNVARLHSRQLLGEVGPPDAPTAAPVPDDATPASQSRPPGVAAGTHGIPKDPHEIRPLGADASSTSPPPRRAARYPSNSRPKPKLPFALPVPDADVTVRLAWVPAPTPQRLSPGALEPLGFTRR